MQKTLASCHCDSKSCSCILAHIFADCWPVLKFLSSHQTLNM